MQNNAAPMLLRCASRAEMCGFLYWDISQIKVLWVCVYEWEKTDRAFLSCTEPLCTAQMNLAHIPQ